MIFGRDRVSCDDFDDCDKIAVVGVDFIGRWPICGLYLKGRRASRTTTLGHRYLRRWSRRGNQGLEVMHLHPIYVVPDDATADILSSIQMRFGPVPKHWILRHV
jgi:hypothetical protein